MFDAPITDKFDSAVTCIASELQIGIIIQCGIAACMMRAIYSARLALFHGIT